MLEHEPFGPCRASTLYVSCFVRVSLWLKKIFCLYSVNYFACKQFNMTVFFPSSEVRSIFLTITL